VIHGNNATVTDYFGLSRSCLPRRAYHAHLLQSIRLDLEEDSPLKPAEPLPNRSFLGCFRSLVRARLLSLHRLALANQVGPWAEGSAEQLPNLSLRCMDRYRGERRLRFPIGLGGAYTGSCPLALPQFKRQWKKEEEVKATKRHRLVPNGMTSTA
jgi:hypothetical protein